MEFPNLGKVCSDQSCKTLDFLPVKCDACENIFCHNHMSYAAHKCSSAYKKNVQVPVCPLCNCPIPVKRGEQPDYAVGAHIDADCLSDPAKDRRKVFTNRCSLNGCKRKEVIPVLCTECQLNYCLKHRHTADHQCQGKQRGKGNSNNKALEAALARSNQKAPSSNGWFSTKSKPSPVAVPAATLIQGQLSEDEALARALDQSMRDALPPAPQSTEEQRQLALAIAASQQQESAHRCCLS